MSAALRPNRGGTVLALGVVSVVAPIAVFALSYLAPAIGQLFFPLERVPGRLEDRAFTVGSSSVTIGVGR